MSATQCLKACLIPPPLSIQAEETCFATVGDLFSYRLGVGVVGVSCFAFSCEIELIWCHCSRHSLSQGARARHRRGEAFSITCLCIPRGTDDKEVLSCVANLPSGKVFPALKNKTDIFILGCQLQLEPGSIRMPWGRIFPPDAEVLVTNHDRFSMFPTQTSEKSVHFQYQEGHG